MGQRRRLAEDPRQIHNGGSSAPAPTGPLLENAPATTPLSGRGGAESSTVRASEPVPAVQLPPEQLASHPLPGSASRSCHPEEQTPRAHAPLAHSGVAFANEQTAPQAPQL